MGSIVISVPDFTDEQLVFDEVETKQILCFFWPTESGRINALDGVGNDLKRLAQTALVAAIEGTFAMGFVVATWKSLNGSQMVSVAKWAKRLASKLVGFAWKHAKRQDLSDTRIYESVRVSVARNIRRSLDMGLNGVAIHRERFHMYAQAPRARLAA